MNAPRARGMGGGILALLLLSACPPADQKARPDSGSSGVQACAHVGQTCEVSPGKLGTCVVKDGCNEQTTTCFVCQSQH
jgi:hypothetical protein